METGLRSRVEGVDSRESQLEFPGAGSPQDVFVCQLLYYYRTYSEGGLFMGRATPHSATSIPQHDNAAYAGLV